ncbi:MAG: XRE family transcriptional regulator [Chloroflexia bacterium]
MPTLGERLRHLRRERGYTLQQVSEGSGLTPSFLSRLERGIVNISVGNLRKVAMFFNVPMTYFFADELVPHALVVRGIEKNLRGDTGPVKRCGLFPEEAHASIAELIALRPGARGEGPLLPVARALYYVLQGELVCTTGDEAQRLRPGDVLYQRRRTPFSWRNEGESDVLLFAAALDSEPA